MPQLPFLLVDAYADQHLSGNPCAVVLDADRLSERDMQRLAYEFKQSETAFISGNEAQGFSLRSFNPIEEIPLAGHPTMAAVTALMHAGRLPVKHGTCAIALALKHGSIGIAVTPPILDGAPYTICMTQPRPIFGVIHDAMVVAPLFGLTPDDLVEHAPVQTVSTGPAHLMLLVRSKAALRKAHPSKDERYLSYRASSDFFSTHLFCLGGETSHGATFSRHFGFAPDIAEDVASGSATGGMAAYLWRYGHLNTREFVAEQGHWLGRPAAMQVRICGPRDAIDHIEIGGQGVVLVEGSLRLPG